MVPRDRIELPYSDYETDVIPLYERGKIIGARRGNRTPTPFGYLILNQARLPISPYGLETE